MIGTARPPIRNGRDIHTLTKRFPVTHDRVVESLFRLWLTVQLVHLCDFFRRVLLGEDVVLSSRTPRMLRIGCCVAMAMAWVLCATASQGQAVAAGFNTAAALPDAPLPAFSSSVISPGYRPHRSRRGLCWRTARRVRPILPNAVCTGISSSSPRLFLTHLKMPAICIPATGTGTKRRTGTGGIDTSIRQPAGGGMSGPIRIRFSMIMSVTR